MNPQWKKEFKGKMGKSIEALKSELNRVRTGRASIALLDGIKVDYYGTPTPLNQVATLAVPESRLITIQPWDTSILSDVEKAILKSDLGLTPNNDGKIIRLAIPRLTQERRRELVKIVRQRVEEGRVAIRHCRRDGLRDLQELQKEKLISEDDFYRTKDDIQDLTDKYIEKAEELGKIKEEEIMEI